MHHRMETHAAWFKSLCADLVRRIHFAVCPNRLCERKRWTYAIRYSVCMYLQFTSIYILHIEVLVSRTTQHTYSHIDARCWVNQSFRRNNNERNRFADRSIKCISEWQWCCSVGKFIVTKMMINLSLDDLMWFSLAATPTSLLFAGQHIQLG